MRRLVDTDPYTGMQTFHTYEGGKNILETVQDVEPILERTAHLAAGLDKKKDWWYVGTIPDTIVLQWAQECGAKPYSKEWQRYAMKQMNRSEYRKLNPNKIQLDTR